MRALRASSIVKGVNLLFAALALAALGAVLFTYLAVIVCLRRRPARATPRPPVTILKPLKGHDDDLFDNLVSFARQRYPRFQIVFGTEDPADPALDVARRVQALHPDVDIAIQACAPPLGCNPKVTNLASLCRLARYDTWLISDSNTRVRPDYLADTTASFSDPDVGMVTSFFVGTGEQGAGAVLENLHLNTFVAGAMAGRQLLTGTALVVGKSMLFHRADLADVGGWTGVADILAEDYVLGTRFRRSGARVVTAHHPIATINRSWTLRRFLNRHVRWGQIRRRLVPAAFFAEPLLNPVLWACLAAPWHASLALAVVAAKIAADEALTQRLRGHGFRLRWLLAIPLKDLVIAGVWLVAAFRRRVWWRGHVMRIGAGTRLLPDAPRRPAPGEPVGA